MQWILYAAVALALAVLWLLSRKTDISDMEVSGAERQFCRMGRYLNNVLQKRCNGRWEVSSRELSLLHPQSAKQNDAYGFQTKRMATALMLLTAGCLISLALSVSAGRQQLIDPDGNIVRNGHMERDQTKRLNVATTDGEELGAFDVTISSRHYTKAETDALFSEAAGQLPALILGDNPSQDFVTTDLQLADRIPGYPFTLTYRMGNYGRIRSDGRIVQEELPEEGEIVPITVEYRYDDAVYEQMLALHVRPLEISEDEALRQRMEALLQDADMETIEEPGLTLPAAIDNRALVWEAPVEDSSAILFLLMAGAAVLSYFGKEKELKREMEARNRQMLSDYPKFVSRIVLYLGAGMTVRNIFRKLAAEYAASPDREQTPRYLYEEVLHAVYVMEGGAAELTAYEQFGLRCGIRQATRLSTLLTQNLKKGNRELLTLLHEESGKAFSERVDLARKRGEEAGTKLLVPMMLLLGIVMIIIMIPAYASF